MLRLPQFSIAQLLGFTFVCALNVWAFVWNFLTLPFSMYDQCLSLFPGIFAASINRA